MIIIISLIGRYLNQAMNCNVLAQAAAEDYIFDYVNDSI